MSTEWWKSAVVYQIYPRSFADSNGDGFGDLRGIAGKLDHLSTLGVDVIWLSPIYKSPQADNGYDISDYQDIDPLFGTLDEFDQLLNAVHEHGMKLMVDLVVNHTSDEHVWFRESRSSRDNPKRDWYIWRDARDGAEPNNWGSFFGGSTWTWDESTEQYYLHLFDSKQPDLNWENAEVRAAVYEMMRWWLERGVDGFRMDVINLISKVEGLPDATPVAGKQFVNAFDLYADGPRVHEYLAEMHREVFADREDRVITVGEMPGVTPQEALLYTDCERAEVNMVFQFEHVSLDNAPGDKFDVIPLDLVSLKQSLHRWQVALGERGWNSLYWNNHDQPRVVSRFGDDHPDWWSLSAKALGTILHGMRGTPYVYQGEELGMTNYPFESSDDYQDLESVNYFNAIRMLGRDEAKALLGLAKKSRDNARTPMQWDDSDNAGFTSDTPWLKVNPNYKWLNATAQIRHPDSVFAHYQSLIRLRHEMPIFAEGNFEAMHETDPALWMYIRTTDTQTMLVLANCSREPRTVELDGWNGAKLLLGNSANITTTLENEITLTGWEAAIFLTRARP